MTKNNNKNEGEDDTHIAIFNGKAIRRKLVNDKWFFSVVDIVGVLTDSTDPNDYWYRLKKKSLNLVALSYRHFVDN